MEGPLRIAMLVTTLTWGGAETQVADLAVRLRRRGHEVLVISMTPPSGLTERLEADGVTWTTLGMKKGTPDLRSLFKLAGIIRAFKPNVLHTHLTHGNLLGRLCRLFVRVPLLISTIHSTRDRHRWADMAYRLTSPLADLTTGVSQAVVDRFVKAGAVSRKRSLVVYNGIDETRFAKVHPQLFPQPDRPYIVCAAGRLTAAKDYPGLLQAMALLRKDGYGPSRIRLVIAGEGELHEELLALCSKLGLNNQVEFAGLQKDLPAFFAKANGFVLSSAWEGFGLVLAEAMACGLPVVSTDCGGTAEILEHGSFGTLVAPNNPEGLSRALRALVDHAATALSESSPSFQSERSAMEKQLQEARASVLSRFGFEKIVESWEAIYHEGTWINKN